MTGANWHAVRAIYTFEMARTWRTLMQSIISNSLVTAANSSIPTARRRIGQASLRC